VLLVLATAAIAVDHWLPPMSRLIGLAPPLISLAFIPDVVRELLYSAPAFFGFVVVWRAHRLRSSAPETWPDRAAIDDFGGRIFDAAALPIAAASLLIGVGIQMSALSLGLLAADPQITGAGVETIEGWAFSSGSSRFARTIVIIALVTGILGVHRRIGAGFGKLLSAGFMVWGVHIGISFAVPFMTGWVTYLPVIGRFAPERSAAWAHALFDLAVACAAWIAAREKWREAPLWSDAEPQEPQPPSAPTIPPPPPPAT
jgi:hypothetical protein